MIFDLPKSLEIDGEEWKIRTDYRDILRILLAFEDANLEDAEKQYVCLYILYVDFERIPPAKYEAFLRAAIEFIDHGAGKNDRPGPRTMDWEQDANILFPAINTVAGYEVRGVDYLHWWTFAGYFMEIREGVASTVLNLRSKKARGKKLEKWEREFWQQNREICQLHVRETDEQREERDRLNALLNGAGK